MRVEHPFRVFKRQFSHIKVRSRRQVKNTAQLHTLVALTNLWLVRRKPLGAVAGVRPQFANAALRKATARPQT